jgi:hypothetical protein
VRESWTLAAEAGLEGLTTDGRPRAVVVVGVGSSAIAADVLAAVAGGASPVPIIGHHDFGLPGWVGVADLVIAVSSSGTAAETLSAAEAADRRGCRLLAVGAPDSPLAFLATRARAPFVSVPPDRPARTAMWALSTPLLAAGAVFGLVRDAAGAVEATAAQLEVVATRCRPSSESFVNPAKMLALELAGSVPMFWGTSPVTAAVAGRAATQLATVAKYPAVAGALPHPAHHQVATFDGVFGARAAASARNDVDDFFRDRVDDEITTRIRLVLLRDLDAEHPEVTRRAETAVLVAAERGVGVTELRAEGGSSFERFASLAGMIDYAAVYLAMVLGVDPGYVLAVDDLDRAR